jgi:hypothetical protein
MRKIFFTLILFSALLVGATRPGAVFLLIWPGARATALSGAFSAVANDATACYYNQAGLAFIDGTIVSLQHAPWLQALNEDMYYEYLGLTKSYKVGTFGLSIIYLTTGPTEVRNFSNVYLGTYTTFDICVGLNYGAKISPNLGLGIGWKFIYSYLVPPWVWGRMPELGITNGGIGITYAFDIGTIYKPFSFLTIAGALQNIGPDISYTESGASDPLPYTLRLGLRFQPIETRVISVALTIDVTKILVGMFAVDTNTFFQNLSYEFTEAWKGVGLEVDYYSFVKLRAGYFYDKEGQRIGFTYGGGITAGGFSLDVGVDQSIYEFTTTNRKFSLSYHF